MSLPLPPERPPELPPAGDLPARLARRIDGWARTARHPLFWVGVRDMAGVSVGLSAWAFMTGVAMVGSGMSVGESVLMSVLVFAGSAQLAALPLIAAGAPMWVIFAAALCVNLRFLVFAVHLREYLRFLPRGARIWLGFFMGDMTYVMFIQRFPSPAETERQRRAQLAYLWGGNCWNWLSWQSLNMLGIFLGAALPARWGLEFAGTLALLAVACSMVTTRLRALSAITAAAAAIVLFELPYRLNIVAAIAVAVAISLYVEPRWPRGGEREGARHA